MRVNAATRRYDSNASVISMSLELSNLNVVRRSMRLSGQIMTLDHELDGFVTTAGTSFSQCIQMIAKGIIDAATNLKMHVIHQLEPHRASKVMLANIGERHDRLEVSTRRNQSTLGSEASD